MSVSSGTVAQPTAERANGLATYLKVIYAPGEAFATLARIPTWGWAMIIGVVVSLIGTLILMPATLHVIQIQQQQQLSQMPADQAARAQAAMAKIPSSFYSIFSIISALIIPWLFWLVGAVVYVVGASLGGGEASFAKAWVAAVNLYVIPLLGTLLGDIIVRLRGISSLNSTTDMFALPSLAMLLHGSPKLIAVLYSFNIINIWFYIVAVIALQAMMKMSRTAAIATIVVLAIISAVLVAAFVK